MIALLLRLLGINTESLGLNHFDNALDDHPLVNQLLTEDSA